MCCFFQTVFPTLLHILSLFESWCFSCMILFLLFFSWMCLFVLTCLLSHVFWIWFKDVQGVCLMFLVLFVFDLFQMCFFPTTLCGVLVFNSVSRVLRPPASSRLPLPHTHHLCHTPSFAHTLSHTLCYTPSTHTNFHTHFVNIIFHTHFVSHHLCHTQLCHTPFLTTIFDRHQLSDATLTHNFVTHQLCLWHTPTVRRNFDTQLCHAPTLHTIFVTRNFVTHHLWQQLCHTPSLTTIFQISRGWRRGTLHGRRGTW